MLVARWQNTDGSKLVELHRDGNHYYRVNESRLVHHVGTISCYRKAVACTIASVVEGTKLTLQVPKCKALDTELFERLTRLTHELHDESGQDNDDLINALGTRIAQLILS